MFEAILDIVIVIAYGFIVAFALAMLQTPPLFIAIAICIYFWLEMLPKS
jgi:hypothetical protein